MNCLRHIPLLLIPLLLALTAACAAAPEEISPTEREQIESLVTDYLERDAAVPDYEVEIAAEAEGWAQVRISPIETTNLTPVYIYLRQDGEPNQAEATLSPENPEDNQDARQFRTETGWTIVIGPQAQFSQEELDAAGVPESLRPETME